MFSRHSSTLAIDLAPDAVRVLDVTFRKDGPRITALATEPLPAGNPVNLPERHLTALATLIAAHRLRSRHCVATLPTNLVVTRSVAIDAAKPLSPPEQIRITLQNCLTFDAADLLFDFWTVSDTAKSRTQEVLVVATQASVVNRYLDGFKRLRLLCGHLDVAPCAISTVVARLAAADTMAGTIVLADNVGYFAVLQRGQVLFWRPFELPSGAVQNAAVTPVALERVGDEISKCVSHMVGSNHLDSLGEIFVFGQGAGDAEVADCLSNRFGLPVRSPSPFDTIPPTALPADVRAALQPGAASHYAAALGLALQPQGVNHG